MRVTRSALTQLTTPLQRPLPGAMWLLKGSEAHLHRRFEPLPGPSQRRAERTEPFPPEPLKDFRGLGCEWIALAHATF